MNKDRDNHELYDPAGYTLKEAVAEARRCLNCVKPGCRVGCPIENEIPAFIRELANGNLGQASAVIARRSNLPAVCGRVCPREKQCEGSCVLNAKGNPIKIGKLERFIADMDGALDITPMPKLWKDKGQVAVIGSGPAGLTVAGDLAKLGFKITVFDAQPEPGGVLMYGIPEFRLSKEVVRREIRKIERLGVEFKTNVLVGIDLTVDDLFAQGFDAVFIGTGNAVAKTLDIEGKSLPGVVEATYLLQMVALVNQGSVDQAEVPVKEGDDVVIVGAGNVAMDVARTVKRLGAAKVTVLFRETEEKIAALPSEVEAAKREGVYFLPLRMPYRFIGEKHVSGIACLIRTLEDGETADSEETEIVPASKVVIAIGQRPAARIITTCKGIEVTEDGYLKTKQRPFGMSTRHGVFSGGDVVHGPATVVKAMKDAKNVAKGIAQYVEAKKLMEDCGLKIKEEQDVF